MSAELHLDAFRRHEAEVARRLELRRRAAARTAAAPAPPPAAPSGAAPAGRVRRAARGVVLGTLHGLAARYRPA